jgi:uncharacterized RDD family membrane protein YckC
MSAVPASIWRRLAAALYDGLLLLGIWMAALLSDVLIRGVLDAPRSWPLLRIYLFAIGLLFFGWFWTHGGQTLGMRAWRLRVVREDGRPLTWLTAAVRFTVMLSCWAAVMIPLFARLPHLREMPNTAIVALSAAALSAIGLIVMLIDRHRRAPHDWLSGCVMIEQQPLPPTPKT